MTDPNATLTNLLAEWGEVVTVNGGAGVAAVLQEIPRVTALSVIVALIAAIAPAAASAQAELSLYGSSSLVARGTVTGEDPGGAGAFSFVTGWNPAAAPGGGSYGARITWWQGADTGWGLELGHVPLQADPLTLAASGIDALELAPGSSIFTLNAFRRWNGEGALVPYVGAGIGLSVPRIAFDGGAGMSEGLMDAGPVVQWLAGARLPLGNRWSVFGEYKGSITANRTALRGGGQLTAEVVNNVFNIGVSLGF